MSGGPERPASRGRAPISRDRWTTLEPLIDAAIELPRERRHVFLDEACAGDAALRAQLDRLLRQYDREDTLLDHPAAERFCSLLDEEGVARLPAVLSDRYRIEGEIGRGGMATVYLAHDVRHERKVAVKVLRRELAAAVGAERFLAEIKTTAQLQHPHILPLHDSGEVDGVLFYIMPYVEGGSLRKLMARERQLPVEDAVRITCEVASALDVAHRQGVIHRDIKPENILLHNGSALVADFGIALAVSGAATSRLTASGVTVGTPQYMSPEQATGERVIDSRSDIYSLGAVLFEMLAGEPPFTGTTTTAVIAKLVALPAPSLRIVRAAIPPAVDAAVARALAREPVDRYRTAGEFAEALQGTTIALPSRSASASGGLTASLVRPQRGWRRRVTGPKQLAAALAVMSVVGAGLGTWAWRAAHRAEARTTVRFPLAFPGDVTVITIVEGSTVTISPDGRMVVFVGVGTGGIQQLFARPLDDIRTRPIPGTVGAVMPFFSTDNKWLGFWLKGSLQKVPLEGGPVVPLADVGRISGASWGPNNVIVVSTGSRLATIPAAGGALRPLTTPDSARGEEEQRWPLALADGKTVLYTSWSRGGLNTAKIGVASLVTGHSTILDLPGTFPLGVVDGLLAYASAAGALMAVPFDAGRGRVTGDPAPVVTDVVVGLLGPAKAGMSRNGSVVYQIGSLSSQLMLADARGVTRPLPAEPQRYSFPRFSPDGKQIAIAIRSSAGSDVWIYDPAQRTTTRLTTDNNSCCPEWTPDGKRVLFVGSKRGEREALWWQPVDRSGPAALLLKLDGADVFTGILSPDGRTLVYETTKYETWYRHLTGDTASKRIAPASAIAATPSLSPDGRWLAYVSNESGTGQVVVQPFPGPGVQVQVSTDGGIEPVWAHGGDRLFFRHNRQIIAANIKTVPTFAVTARAVVFEGPFFVGSNMHTHYDISPGGTEFLFVKTTEDAQTIIVHNWLDELRSRLAAKAAK